MMTKTDLIKEMAKDLNSEKEAKIALDHLLDGITDALNKEGSLRLSGFGTFKVVARKARTGRNPRTGEKITIPARKAVTFTPAKALKASVD
jgi:nucleoid DNA-binding protein